MLSLRNIPRSCPRIASSLHAARTRLHVRQSSSLASVGDLFKDGTNYINGKFVSPSGLQPFQVKNPATGAVIGTIPWGGKDLALEAITAADTAFKTWKQTTASSRAQILRKWYDLMMQHHEALGTLITVENGKPLVEGRGENAYAASFLDWFAGEAVRNYGDVIPQSNSSTRLLALRQPVGPVGCITPWNFPSAMITRKVGAALAAGCTVVIKPSEFTPFSALALCALAERAGVPPGVVNVVTGDAAAIGGALTSDPRIKKITFTGSTRVGKLLMQQSAEHVKRVSFELGGNAPFIVFEDANLERAVDGIIASKFRNAGQTCVCANRILVQASVYDKVSSMLAKKVAALKVGEGTQPGVQIGPLINASAVEKVRRHVEDSVQKGAKILTGGKLHSLGGHFFEPTVLGDVRPGMLPYEEETFGPVCPLFKFNTEQEAIAMANDTPFGLASYFYTQDPARIWRVSEGLEYGMIGVNEPVISNAAGPFGGMKQSGLGREGSKYGIMEYVDIKYVCQGGI